MADAPNDGERTPCAPAEWERLRDRLARIEAALEAATKQVSYLPGQVRNLTGKIDGLTTSVSEPRLRALLLGVLGVYDLVGQMMRDTDGRRGDLDALRTQLRQLLAANGLEEIPADGAFDPEMHRAIRRVSCADPAQENRVVEVVRAGFRTGQAVLRYAEVFVGQYTPPVIEETERRPGAAPDGA